MLLSSRSFWICCISSLCIQIDAKAEFLWGSGDSFSTPLTAALAEWTGKSFTRFYSSISPAMASLLYKVTQIFACSNKYWWPFRWTRVDFTPKFICWQEDGSLLLWLSFSYHYSPSWIMYFRPLPKQENILCSHVQDCFRCPSLIRNPEITFNWLNITSCLAEGKTLHID